MSSHVPAAMPVVRSARYAVQTEGVTCSRKAAVRAVPRLARPDRPAAVSSAAHASVSAAGRRGNPVPLRASITASAPASTVAEMAGASAVQKPDSAKYPAQAALLMLVSAAHDQDTPAVSPVRRRRASWGRNCGTARTAAIRGSELKTACTGDPLRRLDGSLTTKVYGCISQIFVRVSALLAQFVKYP